MSHVPACLRMDPSELRERVARALAELEECRACPRDCDVNRLEDRWGACKTGRYAVVGSYFPHFGEEDCLRGWNGSGTIFFSHCNLRCVFCQNYSISQGIKPAALAARSRDGGGDGGGEDDGGGGAKDGGEAAASDARDGGRGGGNGSLPDEAAPSTPGEIAAMMMELQGRGCHNINFVTPEHVVPQVVEAVAEAVDRGLELPIVYNTSAYDALESLRLMEGLVDVYMPDFKFWSAEGSRKYMKAGDYPEVARAAVREMHRQVGKLVVDEDGLAKRGLIVRHLVMPGMLDETRGILRWVAEELGPDTRVNFMDQYRPAGKVGDGSYAEIDRRLASSEFREARAMARELGLRNLDRRDPHPRLQRTLNRRLAVL